MSIRLSPRHGVNPSLGVCFYCGKESGEIILPGQLRGDVEAPHKAVWHMEPCDACKALMAQGVILIQVRTGDEGPNPYRMGPQCVVKDAAIARMINEPLQSHILKCRWAYVPQDAWQALGLPENPSGPDNPPAQ